MQISPSCSPKSISVRTDDAARIVTLRYSGTAPPLVQAPPGSKPGGGPQEA